MTVPTVNLTIEKGTDFDATFTVTNSDGTPFPLNNYSATSKIRKHSAATTSKSFQTSITIARGEIKISMGSSITADLSPGRNYYDVIITQISSGKITKVFEGAAIVSDTVSI
jgi:hypothetical protein